MSNVNFGNMRIEDASFIVLDFETVTPKGRPPEPIELGAIRINPGFQVDSDFKISRLIKPPKDAPITMFDTQQTGIRWSDVIEKPPAEEVLKQFETLLQERNYIMVAQNAKYEAAIISRFSNICKHIISMPFVDTILLAKYLVPQLSNYKLDTLSTHFSIPIPINRHRSLPDVEITGKVLLKLLAMGVEMNKITIVANLTQIAGIKMQVDEPKQRSLFE